MKQSFLAIIQHLSNFIRSVFSALSGVNEIMFILGAGAIFIGVRGLFSLYHALIACGALFIAVSLAGVIMQQRKTK